MYRTLLNTADHTVALYVKYVSSDILQVSFILGLVGYVILDKCSESTQHETVDGVTARGVPHSVVLV